MTRVSQGNLPEMNHSSRHFFLFRLSRGCVGSIGSVRRWFRRRPLLRVAKRFIGHAGPTVRNRKSDVQGKRVDRAEEGEGRVKHDGKATEVRLGDGGVRAG